MAAAPDRHGPNDAILAAAEHALAAVTTIGHAEHAYVRVDGVVSNGRFLIMELELIEPFLHLAAHPAAAERLAQEVARPTRPRSWRICAGAGAGACALR